MGTTAMRILAGTLLALAVAPLQAEVLRRPAGELAPLEAAHDDHHRAAPRMDPLAEPVPLDPAGFGLDPAYEEHAYDPQAQYEVYGGKRAIDKVRPLVELGQPLYSEGPLGPAYDIVGSKNLVMPQFYAYGDWRNAVGINDNGAGSTGIYATRLNLDVDLRLTATERVHALFRPFEDGTDITSYRFLGGSDAGRHELETFGDAEADALFFEGDLGAITSGLRDGYTQWDLPFAFGLMPLVYQNGTWMDDAVKGVAATVVSSRNSARLDISNMDVVLFAADDRVNAQAIGNAYGVVDEGAAVMGVATFIEAREGYLEAGYGYTRDTLRRGGLDFGYHNLTLAWTKRYAGRWSNSLRIITNAGQDPGPGVAQTADGTLLLVESSLITAKPSTLVPYLNLFVGNDVPQALARDAGAGGVLKNTGLAFETDGLTGFPKLNDTGAEAMGAALGVQYLFALNRQLVVELATVLPTQQNAVMPGNEAALSVRFQEPLGMAWIFRADAIAAARESTSDLAGVRVELRRKF